MSLTDMAMSAAVRAMLKRYPGMWKLATQFMSLYDAAEVVEETKSPGGEDIALYLRTLADSLLRRAGVPDELIKTFADKRPPLDERKPSWRE